ncbi:hypothetical protein [Flavobacterium degerlachei]|jgi:hypothetical protein|uniref:Uncharacterized protein n=1 Tax=Flavobacterium degerlachei TaxID=229203 RepID=A0A1H3DQI5_9FLAO|nr:hypothetical protein [Flavobacterium degerlachei]SDX68597.1 hypothetical protein SAMN05444338_11378 [Flavobacterium degerlachei]
MNSSERKYKIIEQLLKVEEESTLYQIENILNEGDGWDEIPPIVQKLIEKAIEQSDAGVGIPHEQVMSEIKKKYNFS